MVRAGQVFDSGKHIAFGIAALSCHALNQACIDGQSRSLVGCRIPASNVGAAVDPVRARSASQAVVANSSLKPVIPAVSGQRIRMR